MYLCAASKLFMYCFSPQDPLLKGQRCVILADGFYEWKKHEKGKQPFFIYFPQTQGSSPSKTSAQCDSSTPDLHQVSSKIFF